MIEKLVTLIVLFTIGVVFPILWCFINGRLENGEKIKIKCLLTGHSYLTEVHYGEYPKAICKASIMQRCERCDHTKLLIYKTTTSFMLPSQYTQEETKPKLRVVK